MASKEKNRANKLSKAIGLPEGALGRSLYVQLYSNTTVNIEGNCSVLNYSQTKIAINAPDSILNIIGTDLSIDEFSQDYLNISGQITSISFS